MSSVTARRRSLGLRTTPRPPAQTGVRAAGATMEEGDACIFEPEINFKIKNKTKKKSEAMSSDKSLPGCNISPRGRKMKAADVGFAPAFYLGGSLCTPHSGSSSPGFCKLLQSHFKTLLPEKRLNEV